MSPACGIRDFSNSTSLLEVARVSSGISFGLVWFRDPGPVSSGSISSGQVLSLPAKCGIRGLASKLQAISRFVLRATGALMSQTHYFCRHPDGSLFFRRGQCNSFPVPTFSGLRSVPPSNCDIRALVAKL